jgi:hypothetical protein
VLHYQKNKNKIKNQGKKKEKKGLVMRANKHYLNCWVLVDLILQFYFSGRIFAKFQPENL